MPRQIAAGNEVELELPDTAGLADLIAALRSAIPGLEGPVILAGEDNLTDNYGFNINGRFYTDGKEVRVRPGDRVALLALATGG